MDRNDTVPFAAVTGNRVIINAGTGNDVVTLGGAFAPSNSTAATMDQFALNIDGQGGNDLINWAGGSTLFTTTVNGEEIILTADVTTTGNQIWDGPVLLGADLEVAGADITFADTVDGAQSLTVARR